MTPFTKEQFDTAFKALATEQQDAILGEQMNATLVQLLDAANLTPKQRIDAAQYITATLIGIQDHSTLVSVLAQCGIPATSATTIAQSVRTSLLPLLPAADIQLPAQLTVQDMRSIRSHAEASIAAMIATLSTEGSLESLPCGPAMQERWQTLPGPVRASILDQDYKHAVRNAVAGHMLSEKEFESLEEEVLMTLLGLQSKAAFAQDLQSQVPSLTAQDAVRVAQHIDEHYFELLSPYLDNLDQGKKTTDDQNQTNMSQSGTAKNGTMSPLEQFVHKQEDVRERFAKLPDSVRETILSGAVADAFAAAVRTHNLDQAQFTQFGTSVVRVLVGLSTTKDFRGSLEVLGVPTAEHDTFAAEVEQGMFKPVRDAIVSALALRTDDHR